MLLPTDSFETVEKILACLRAQPRAGRLEIVFVTPSGAGLEDGDTRVHGFAGVRVIEVPDVASLPRARARALRAASAPLVLFAETHAYPNAEYLDRLVEAHAGPWPVVGPAIGNANPGSLMSWASLLMDYGRWVEAEESGPIEDVPGHNSVYKRDLLLALDDLDELMTADTIMHAELRARGHELYLEPAARVDHLNVSQLRWALVERFESGRDVRRHAVARLGAAAPARVRAGVAADPVGPVPPHPALSPEMQRRPADAPARRPRSRWRWVSARSGSSWGI